MQYIKLAIETTSEAVEPLCGALMDLGLGGFEIEDRADFLEFLENHKHLYDYIDEELMNRVANAVRVIVYISDTAEGMETVNRLKDILAELRKNPLYGSLELSSSTLNEEDWSESWKKYFHPTPIGEKILVVPVWETEYDRNGRIEFRIDPGMVFGTGTHESTRMCIEAAERVVTSDCTVADVGCGSGILSIVSLLLGAKTAVGLDIDPNAEHIAMENAALNAQEAKYRVYTGNAVTDMDLRKNFGSGYDVVYANIVADVIMALTPWMYDIVNEGGKLVTSGIIDERADEVRKNLEQNGFEIVEKNTCRGWVCYVATKNGK